MKKLIHRDITVRIRHENYLNVHQKRIQINSYTLKKMKLSMNHTKNGIQFYLVRKTRRKVIFYLFCKKKKEKEKEKNKF